MYLTKSGIINIETSDPPPELWMYFGWEFLMLKLPTRFKPTKKLTSYPLKIGSREKKESS